jgi:hypothetical protein
MLQQTDRYFQVFVNFGVVCHYYYSNTHGMV